MDLDKFAASAGIIILGWARCRVWRCRTRETLLLFRVSEQARDPPNIWWEVLIIVANLNAEVYNFMECSSKLSIHNNVSIALRHGKCV
jgi:hypothetical protein